MDLEWILGVDLTERSHGAWRFAAWLYDHSIDPRPRITALHVLDPRREYADDAPPPQVAIDRLREDAQALGVAHAFAGMEVLPGPSVDDKLCRFAATSHSGLIVGRAAQTHGWSLTKLGRTARRLLRVVPTPLCVVPPDLETIQRGPVLVAIEDDPACHVAAAFAVALAANVQREVVALHVVADPRPIPVVVNEPGLPPPVDARLLEEIREGAAKRLARTMSELELPQLAAPRIEIGDPVPAIAQLARELHAACIVCGSRRLGLTDRILQSSVGTDLAAHVDRPVIVVPPDFHAPGL